MEAALRNQHLIDPEICIRCNTCEATCPRGAVTHDDRNYVVKADLCGACMDCVAPCPTGAIDNWRTVPTDRPYSVEEQLSWDSLPADCAHVQADSSAQPLPLPSRATADVERAANAPEHGQTLSAAAWNASVPPWSAAHPYTNLYVQKAPTVATVVGNYRVTAAHTESDIRHVVLDFGGMPFPVLEGQSIGIIAPGSDADGRPHAVRQYSVASPRNGERPGYNNVSLTVKRVIADHAGRPVRGVCSNYICDLQIGDTVKVIGPFGSTFLMPNHPRSNIVMICTGTGSAPMRAMTEWRRRLKQSGKFEGGKLLLFFGARTRDELPYFGPLMKLPADFIDVNLAFSRMPDQRKAYVQDLMRRRADELAALLRDPDTFVYMCGLRDMEAGVLAALCDVATEAGLEWESFGLALKREGRLHIETY